MSKQEENKVDGYSAKTLTLINLIITSQLQLEYLDDLKQTNAYKHKVKNLSNSLIKELEKHLDTELKLLYENEEEITVNLLRNFSELIQKLSILEPAEIIAYNQLLNHYKEDVKGYVERNKITLVKLNS